jgi:hypothetical protein
MRRSGEPPTFGVGPLVRAVRDPETLLEAQGTAVFRVETTAIDTARLVQARHAARDFATFDGGLAALAAVSAFSEVAAFAQKTSAWLSDVVGAPLRPKLERSDATNQSRGFFRVSAAIDPDSRSPSAAARIIARRSVV